MKTRTIPVGSNVYIYGTGNFAKQFSEAAINLGFYVIGFIDHLKVDESLRIDGIDYKIFHPDSIPKEKSPSMVILGIGNGYANLLKIYESLRGVFSTEEIFSPVEFAYICGSKDIKIDCYWLQSKPDFYNSAAPLVQEMLQNFEDERSKKNFLDILKYREFGQIVDLPIPDQLSEQYLPIDLGTPPTKLQMLDLGACRGENLEYFLALGHKINFGLFFEPDVSNFEFLSSKLRSMEIENSLVVPLAAWNSTEMLSFDATSDTSSHLSTGGGETVQAVRISDLVATTKINYVKMDIEGAEFEALLGLEDVLKRDIPHLAVCVYHRPDDIWKIGLWLKNLMGESYSFHLRIYSNQTFETVLYAIPKS